MTKMDFLNYLTFGSIPSNTSALLKCAHLRSLKFVLFLVIQIKVFAQTDGFQAVHGSAITQKVEDIDSYNHSGYQLEFRDHLKNEIYSKAIASFNRLNEFRLAKEENRVALGGDDGYLLIQSWQQLGIKGAVDGPFANRRILFVLNSNNQLKEQFLD
jgi:hypothetical protein